MAGTRWAHFADCGCCGFGPGCFAPDISSGAGPNRMSARSLSLCMTCSVNSPTRTEAPGQPRQADTAYGPDGENPASSQDADARAARRYSFSLDARGVALMRFLTSSPALPSKNIFSLCMNPAPMSSIRSLDIITFFTFTSFTSS